MCGRYTLFTDKEYQDIRKIIRAVQEKGHEVKTGEIYPTNPAPILVWEERGVVPQAVKWGWPKFGTQKSNNSDKARFIRASGIKQDPFFYFFFLISHFHKNLESSLILDL